MENIFNMGIPFEFAETMTLATLRHHKALLEVDIKNLTKKKKLPAHQQEDLDADRKYLQAIEMIIQYMTPPNEWKD